MKSMTARVTASREPVVIRDFADECLVVCPDCEGAAVAVRHGDVPRFICAACGKQRRRSSEARRNGAFDPHFGLPLWLQISCAGQTLWAFNRRHLSFLREYVAATDRRRPRIEEGGPRNAVLSSRLPRWMILARHRADVLRGLDRLNEKLLRVGEPGVSRAIRARNECVERD
jgi:hypothetical protein